MIHLGHSLEELGRHENISVPLALRCSHPFLQAHKGLADLAMVLNHTTSVPYW
jgi:hypothetical protein